MRFGTGDRPRVRLLLETRGGWRKGEDWNSFARMFSRTGKIAEFATDGAGYRQSELRGLCGARLRPTLPGLFGGAGIGQPHTPLWQ